MTADEMKAALNAVRENIHENFHEMLTIAGTDDLEVFEEAVLLYHVEALYAKWDQVAPYVN